MEWHFSGADRKVLRRLEAVIIVTTAIFVGHQLHDFVVEGSEVVRQRFSGLEPSIGLVMYTFFMATTLLAPLWFANKLCRRRKTFLALFGSFVALWSYIGILFGGGHLYGLASWLAG